MGCDMRDYASALKDSLRDVVEVQEKVDAYNERQTDSAYKLHIGDDGGIYTSYLTTFRAMKQMATNSKLSKHGTLTVTPELFHRSLPLTRLV